MVGDVAEALVERPGHGEEEVQVDERARDREEDLLHEVGGERAGDRRARDDRDEHEQRDEGADVRRQKIVHGHAHGVRGDYGGECDLAGVRGAENAVVGESRKDSLARLEEETGNDVAGRNRLDLIPELRQPPPDVDAQQIEHDQHQRGAEQPGPDLDEPATTGGVVERKNRPRVGLSSDFGHRHMGVSRSPNTSDASTGEHHPIGVNFRRSSCDPGDVHSKGTRFDRADSRRGR